MQSSAERHLGKIYYLAEIDQTPKVGEIKNTPQSTTTVIQYNGKSYETPTKWIMEAFCASGKFIRFPDIPKYQDTPRKPAFYQPPKKKRSFGEFV